MHWFGFGVSWWGYALMMIGMLAFWAVAVGGVVLLLRRPGRGDLVHASHRSPEQLPAERRAYSPAPHPRGLDDTERTARVATPDRHVRP